MRKTIIQALCVFICVAAASLWGQSVSGTLSGKVTNGAGAGIPNAAVTITEVSTNTTQKVLTAPDGSFSVSGLAPGTYRVDVETQGYKRTSQQNVELTTTGPASVNVVLEPGNTNETVQIKAHASSTQGENAEVSVALDTRTVHELPVVDRNHEELVGLQQGITPPTTALDAIRDPDRNRFYSTDGQTPPINLWQLDGVTNLEPFRGVAVRVIPEEAIQQLNIETANLTDNQGFTAGAVVTPMMRGGTNSFHGSLFEFWSGDPIRARDFFDVAGVPNPRFVYNQMGGTAGGAVVPDKTFLFGSYEGTFQNGDNTALTTVPTAAAAGGNFSGIPGVSIFNPTTGTPAGTGRSIFGTGVIPQSLINPAARAIARFIPAPNLPGFFDNYVTDVPYRNHASRADGRLDQRFSDRTSAFLRYGYTNDWDIMGSPLGNVIGGGSRGRLLSQNAVADLAHEFSASLITDFRFGYNRYDQKLNGAANQTPLANSLGLTGFTNGLVGINISGLAPIGAPPYVPEHAVDNDFNWHWSWAYHSSFNDFRAGVDVRRYRSDGFTDSVLGQMFGPSGTAYFGPGATLLSGGAPLSPAGYLYNSYAAFLLGAPSQVGAVNYLTTPTIRQTESAIWVGDKIQFKQRFTLDLGVRYEIYSPLEPMNAGGASSFSLANNSFNFAGIGGNNMHPWTYDTDAVAPRIGIAARVTTKTTVRAGYGWEYFQLPYMYAPFMPSFFGFVNGTMGTYSVAPMTGAFGPTVTTPAAPKSLVNGSSAGNLPVLLTSRSLDTPYVQNINFQIQQEFYGGSMLSLAYVGALGRHMPFIENLNAALPGTGAAGLPYIGGGRTTPTLLYQDALTSNYNSLQVSLNKRFAQGLSFLASYTFSKALGYTAANEFLLNPFNLRSNYGPLDYDRQHVLTISHIWELPFGRHGSNLASTILGGWQLNGIFTWATGTPLTVTADPITCACPGNTVLASLVRGANPILNTGTAFLNPAAFSVSPNANFGNLSRGELRGPDLWNYNLSLFKSFRVRDRFNMELRGEAYNLTNTPHFTDPVTNFSSPAFGQELATTEGGFGRQINVALRILF